MPLFDNPPQFRSNSTKQGSGYLPCRAVERNTVAYSATLINAPYCALFVDENDSVRRFKPCTEKLTDTTLRAGSGGNAAFCTVNALIERSKSDSLLIFWATV